LFDAELQGRVYAKMRVSVALAGELEVAPNVNPTICALSRSPRFIALPKEMMYGMWNWEKLSKDCGSRLGRATMLIPVPSAIADGASSVSGFPAPNLASA
jgi:hypothetical protein